MSLDAPVTRRPAKAATRASAARAAGPAPVEAGAARHRELRAEWLATVDALRQRRANLVSERAIADYVALQWLEWSGGALRLTATGSNVCQQLRAGME